MQFKKPKTIPITNDLLATRSQRFGNYIIDMIAHNIINVIPLLIGLILSEFFGNYELSYWVDSINPLVDFLIGYIIVVLYYFTFESLTGKSLGKMATNTKVLMEDGSEPTTHAVFIRSISRLIPFEQFSFLSDVPRGWHDSIAKTVVVDVKRYNQALESYDAIDEIGKEQE
ncbi:MAG: RDD family protein [Flavobacterium sp.]|jgi:uncharacterized RDD family membrane protein YckC|uniref:RDD family protein n=1 Tax=Flavobacterium sp. TaxID=239 RepID=UPI003BA534C9